MPVNPRELSMFEHQNLCRQKSRATTNLDKRVKRGSIPVARFTSRSSAPAETTSAEHPTSIRQCRPSRRPSADWVLFVPS